MKDFIAKHVPSQYRDQALNVYSVLPSIPQLPESDDQAHAGAPNYDRDQQTQPSVSFTEQRQNKLADFINYTVILLSVAGQFSQVYIYLAFKGDEITGSSNPSAEEEDGGGVPALWTLITCVLFESNWIFLAINLLLINYFVGQLEQIWSRRGFSALVIFSALCTGLLRLAFRVTYANTIESADAGEKGIMAQPYCSLNHLVILILMGCRQGYPERILDTGIPFITESIILPFKQLPTFYVFLCWLLAFVFEMSIDFSLFGTLYFSWLFLRFFMVNKQAAPNQVGDVTAAFALTTFFPERAQATVDWIGRVGHKFFNLCKLLDGIQACLRARNVAHAKSKAENRKKALEMLQDEIDKKEEAKKERDDEDLEAAASKPTDSDVIVKKSSFGSEGLSLNKRSTGSEKDSAELVKFKKLAASADLTIRQPTAPAGSESGATTREETKVELKDEPDDDDEGDDVEI